MNMLECHACGARFRTALQEAFHRHNFPAFCRRGTRFKAWEKAVAKDKDEAADERTAP